MGNCKLFFNGQFYNTREEIEDIIKTTLPVQKENLLYEVLGKGYKALEEGIAARATREAYLEATSDPSYYSEPQALEVMGGSIRYQKNTYSIEVINKLMNRLSTQLGIKYHIITESEATELTKDTKNPWSGEQSFFYAGEVYFVGTELTPDMVFHEFAHPFIKSIVKTNKSLVDKLFETLSQSPEGADIIKEVLELYPEVSEDKERLMEEVLVRALTKQFENTVTNQTSSKGFLDFIKELFYQIKQLLRSTLGKTIDISSLSETTTLEDLANMLIKGGDFKIDTELVTEKDVVDYLRSNAQQIKEVAQIDTKAVDDMIINGFSIVRRTINLVKNSKNYRDMLDILADEFGRGDLFEIQKNLKRHAHILEKKMEMLEDDVKEAQTKSLALVNSLVTLDKMIEKLTGHLKELSKDVNDKDNLIKVFYYNNVIKAWEGFIQDGLDALSESNLESNSELSIILNRLKQNVAQSKKYIQKVQSEGLKDIIYQELSLTRDNIDKKYNTIIKNLRDREASPKIIETWEKEYYGMTLNEYKEYEELKKLSKEKTLRGDVLERYDYLRLLSYNGAKITEEKIEAAISGELPDANYANSFFEGYMYNTDPLIGGLASYIKNEMTDVLTRAQEKANDFLNDISPALKKAGYNHTNVAELAEKITFIDKVGSYDEETKTYVEKYVRTFLNPFKDYRAAYDKHLVNIKLANINHDKYGTKETELAIFEANKEFRDFLRKYFHQEYVDEYYTADEALSATPAGQLGLQMYEQVIQAINEETKLIENESDMITHQRKLDLLWREYANLFSKYDKYGELKKGTKSYKNTDGTVTEVPIVDIVEALQEHRKRKAEFNERKLIPGLFQSTFQDYEQQILLENPNLVVGSEEYMELINKWIKKNTRTVVKPSFYKRKQDILSRLEFFWEKLRKEGNVHLTEKDPITGEFYTKEYNLSEMQKELNEIMSAYRDSDSQPIGTDMNAKMLKRIKALEEKMELIKDKMEGSSGLSKEESRELAEIKDTLENERVVKGSDEYLNLQERRRELLNKMTDSVLDPLQQREMRALLKELGSMQGKVPTSYYIDVVNAHLESMDPKLVAEVIPGGELTLDNYDDFLNSKFLYKLFKNEKFKEWFHKNHYIKRIFDKSKNEEVEIWVRSSAWSVSRPRLEMDIDKTSIKLSNGQEIKTDMPAMRFYKRVVKPKYRTERIVGVTIDNQRHWLPKLTEDNPYRNNEYFKLSTSTDPKERALFEVLQKMTYHHLKNQEGLGYKEKLYMDIPRFQKDFLEIVRTEKFKKTVKGSYESQFPFMTSVLGQLRRFYKKTKDAPDSGFNHNDEFIMTRIDMMDSNVSNIPMAGIYEMDVNEVSLDLPQALMRYMLSAERHKKLVELNPIAAAAKSAVDNPRVKKQMVNRGLFTWFSKKDKSVRKLVVNNFIEREFEGKTNKGWLSDTPAANTLSKLVFKRASFGFFALNIPSALKNAMGAKFQAQLEAVGGKHFNTSDLVKGEIWSSKAMMELSSQVYSRDSKSLNVQIMEVFDPIQGRFTEKFGENLSRTLTEDIINLSWVYNFRKWTESQATVQIFAALANREKIKTKDGEINYLEAWEIVDGNIKLKPGIDIRYSNKPIKINISLEDTLESIAKKYNIDNIESVISEKQLANIKTSILSLQTKFEKDSKPLEQELISLQERIDSIKDIKLLTKQHKDRIKVLEQRQAEINEQLETLEQSLTSDINEATEFIIDNRLFKAFKNTMHQIQNNLQGAYASYDQPEMQRYLAFRFISFLRRFFTPMLLNRFGYTGNTKRVRARINYGLGDMHEGYYITTLKSLTRIVSVDSKYLMYMTPDEKSAWRKLIFEVVTMYIFSLLIFPLLGWDPDDEDNYENLRKRSGSMPFFGLSEDDDEFHFGGFMMNHALNLAMQVRNENEQFLPVPGLGLDDYTALLNIKSVATGPTLESYSKILNTLFDTMSGNPSAKYKRDMGPYKWQKKDSNKIWNYTLKAFGLTGSTLDPVNTIKNFQSIQVRGK